MVVLLDAERAPHEAVAAAAGDDVAHVNELGVRLRADGQTHEAAV